MEVIINADDLGYSRDTNQAIFSLMDHRRITSATLLANGPAFEDAVRRIPDYPDCSFGVHLNITEFSSLTRADVFREENLVNDDGVFTGDLLSLHPCQALKDAVLREWEQHVQKVLDSGVRISHLDSHHHAHTRPWLFTPLKRLQKKFGIRKVRGTFNLYHGQESQPSIGMLLRKKAWSWALRSFYRTRTTDYFTPFVWFLAKLEGGGTEMRGTAELMCHPGHPYFPGQQYDADEKRLLWSEWINNPRCDLKLISYNQL